MMKNIQKKYSPKQLDYINLDKLGFEVLKQNDSFYKLMGEYKIRRNLPYTGETIKQTVLFDLNELCLLSRIHIRDTKVMRITLEIAADEKGPFLKIENDMTLVTGQIRVIKVGSLPCRYFKITVTKGSPITNFAKIDCFGLHINDIKNKYDEETLDILFYNSYDLIYRNGKINN